MTELSKEFTLQNALMGFIGRDDVPTERVEKFLDMSFRLKKEASEEAFNIAMVRFQKNCPIIKKNKKIKNGNGSTRFEYAPLDEVVYQVKKFLARNGLSYTFNVVKYDEELQDVIVTVRHIEGYSRDFHYPYAPIDDGGSMNGSQRRKSALSYAKRAAFENAFGIITQGEDDDATRAIDSEITEDQKTKVLELVESTGTRLEDLLSYLGSHSLEELSEAEGKKALQALKQKRLAHVRNKSLPAG